MNYIELDVVPIICTKVDKLGTCVKAYGFCLRVPQEAIDVPRENKCFVSITPQQWECPVFSDNELPGINAHSAQVIECRSFNYHRPLLKPLQLEIPHCANIGDLNECRVSLWHRPPLSDSKNFSSSSFEHLFSKEYYIDLINGNEMLMIINLSMNITKRETYQY